MKAATGSVRIIGGRWRGTRLPVLDVPGLRPTSDRARETLFNWLAPALPGARVLDLFAGSGALGLEALSRGAREAVLVERDRAAAGSLRHAVARLHADAQAQVVVADAIEFLRAPLQGRFDVVFLDPPFAADPWPAIWGALPPWLAADAWVYAEWQPAAATAPHPGLRLHREGRTRDARHALYRRGTLAADPSETGVPPE